MVPRLAPSPLFRYRRRVTPVNCALSPSLLISFPVQVMECLVVTHDVLMEEVFRRILTEMGAAVEFRGDAKSGLAALEERRFDVVAIDCDDVYQAAGLLRAAHLSR